MLHFLLGHNKGGMSYFLPSIKNFETSLFSIARVRKTLAAQRGSITARTFWQTDGFVKEKKKITLFCRKNGVQEWNSIAETSLRRKK